jgi:hypothetical protein
MKFIEVHLLYMTVCFSCYVFDLSSAECGKRPSGRGNSFGSAPVKKETPWPWLVALVNWPKDELFCGGSLISEKHVLSGE